MKRVIALILTFTLCAALTVPAAAAAATTFTDVKPTQWHYVPVMQAAELGLINGFEDGRFGPDEGITRAQMMQILYAKYGTDMGTASGFSDVPEDAWFAKPITWAVNKGLITPVSADKFDPNAPLGREAMVYSLYALAGSPAADRNALNAFKDKDTVAEYAKDAFAWNVSKNIVSGMSATELGPKGNATRAQVAVIVTRYLQNVDGVTLPDIEVPDTGRNADGTTNADNVNSIHNVSKDAAYPTKGSTAKANANGYYTEANVYVAESTLRYDLLDELNKYLTSEGLRTATWVTLDEAEEYTLMRAHEADLIWHMDGVKDLDHDKMADVMHARIDGRGLIAPENLAMARPEDAHAVMQAWINSDGHRALLKTAPGYEVCFASSGDVCVMTVYSEAQRVNAVKYARDNYFGQY